MLVFVLMGDGLIIQEGSSVKATRRIAHIPVSEAYLGAFAILIFDPTPKPNLSFDPPRAYSLATTPNTKATNVSPTLEGSTLLDTLYLMKHNTL